MDALVAVRTRLKNLRKRRGAFSTAAAAEAEIARILDILPEDSLERRIFVAVEVERAPVKTIAARIGVSERHVYRVRNDICARLAAWEETLTVRPVEISERTRLASARLLHTCGHVREATEIVRDVLRAPTLPLSCAIEALALSAMLSGDDDDNARAKTLIAEARSAATRLPDAEARIALRGVDIAEAYLPYRSGRSDRAIDLTETALSRITGATTDPYELRALARDWIFAGVQHQEGGSPQRALECLLHARLLLQRLPVPPGAESAQIRIHCAFARAALPEQSAQAYAEAEQALAIAQWHGLPYEEMWALLALAILRDMSGKPGEGVGLARAALGIARTRCDGDPLARALFITARVEGAAGAGSNALRLLESARPLIARNGLLSGILDVARARAYRQRREDHETIEAATSAIGRLEGRALTHYLGIPYLARATASDRIGNDARDDVERAIYYLDAGGALADRADALELSARLNRNRQHAKTARELRRAAAQIAG